MDFRLTPEQEMLRKVVKEFAETEVKPKVVKIDKTGKMPEELIKRLAELGLIGLGVPEAYNGSGMGFIERAIAVEELGKVCAGLAAFLFNTYLGIDVISQGSEEQKKKYLPPIIKAEKKRLLLL